LVLLFKALIGVGFQLVLFGTLLLAPIGTLNWPHAVSWLLVYAALSFASCVFLALFRPKALEARLRAGRQEQAQGDRPAFLYFASALFLSFILPGLDVHYWSVFPEVDDPVRGVGLVIFLLGYIFVLLSMLANEFAAPTVHMQTDAGHALADRGVYRLMRHPMYFGFLLFCAGSALWLGSYFSALASIILLMLATIYRIRIEEAFLVENLSGYADYMARVKTRFLPLIY
jgi:protein-S-isoprenylcysteine O-methyltransferase Ste14|tara:strand:+ start:552 stop:1238 length:687 start_codon:yes stop_codon:yes gene_type:complete